MSKACRQQSVIEAVSIIEPGRDDSNKIKKFASESDSLKGNKLTHFLIPVFLHMSRI